jgi:hypothetical protein
MTNCSTLNFLIYEGNFIFFFISVQTIFNFFQPERQLPLLPHGPQQPQQLKQQQQQQQQKQQQQFKQQQQQHLQQQPERPLRLVGPRRQRRQQRRLRQQRQRRRRRVRRTVCRRRPGESVLHSASATTIQSAAQNVPLRSDTRREFKRK